MRSRIAKLSSPGSAANRRVAVALLLAAGWLLAASPSAAPRTPTPAPSDPAPVVRATTGAAPGYVDDAVCGSCHAELAASFEEVGMARSFYRPSPERDVEILTGPGNRFVHEPSGRVYEMERRGGELLFRRFEIGPDGEPVNLFETGVDWILGSGNHSRSYLYRNPAGELFLLPLSWYSQERKWGMSPGFDGPEHPGIRRQVTRECMFCHNAYPEAPAGSDAAQAPDVFPAHLPEGIGCQRCHGPGAEHVDLALGGVGSPRRIRDAIVDPGRLDPVLRDDVCWQCHLQPTVVLPAVRRLGRGTWSYRPGEPLSDYMLHVDIEETERSHGDRFEINHHPYRLRQSRCWTESSRRLSCLTCHDPHRKVPAPERAAHYRAACLTCHETADCGVEHAAGLPDEVATVDRLDCVACHMPQRRTQDVVHVVMTDHLIRRRPGGGELVAPRPEVDPVVEGIRLLEPERAPPGPMGRLLTTLGLVRVAGGLSREGLDLLATGLREVAARPGSPPLTDARFDLGKGQLKAGDWDAAAATLERILVDQPGDPVVLELLAVARNGQGRREEAVELMGRAAAAPGARPEAHYNLGTVLLGAGKLDEAAAALGRAVALRPTFADAWNQLGRVRARRGEIQTAIEAHRTALSVEPRSYRPYLDLAELLAAAGRRDEAREVLRHGARSAALAEPVAEALARFDDESRKGESR